MEIEFLELPELVSIFGFGFMAGMLIGMGTWAANKVVQVFKKFF